MLEQIKNILSLIIEKFETPKTDIGFPPNQEFKSLIEKGILTSNQDIIGHFKKQTFIGRLTPDGFFNLNISGETISCIDFKQATFIAWGKDIPNDGWKVWRTIDNKTGKMETLDYLRHQLWELL